MSKRYYWLKLKDNFFRGKHVKMLRNIAGGDTYTIIYLKMMLLAIKTDGYIYYDGICETPEEEVALAIDEQPENAKVAINLLIKFGAVEIVGEDYYLPETVTNTGSEGASAERMRRKRTALVDNKASHCDVEKEKREREEKIQEKIQEKEKRESREKEKRFTPPTRDDVINYCAEKGFEIDADRFIDYYAANGWKVGRNPMKSWKAAVNNWHRRDLEQGWQKRKEEQDPYLKLLEEEETNYITAEVSIFESDGNDPDAGNPKRSIPDNL